MNSKKNWRFNVATHFWGQFNAYVNRIAPVEAIHRRNRNFKVEGILGAIWEHNRHVLHLKISKICTHKRFLYNESDFPMISPQANSFTGAIHFVTTQCICGSSLSCTSAKCWNQSWRYNYLSQVWLLQGSPFSFCLSPLLALSVIKKDTQFIHNSDYCDIPPLVSSNTHYFPN